MFPGETPTAFADEADGRCQVCRIATTLAEQSPTKERAKKENGAMQNGFAVLRYGAT